MLRRRTAPTFAFCEPVTATTLSVEHLRALDAGGPRPHGGIVGTALCGRDLTGGWDIVGRAVDTATVDRLAAPGPDGRAALCRGCADRWRADHP